MKSPESVSPDLSRVQQLKKLVAQGEGLTLEFKRKATYPEKILREIIAFANTQGGILLIGVNDDKTIPGLKYPEDDSHVIKEAIKKCKPKILFEEDFIPVGNSKVVIQYVIHESDRKPHYLEVNSVKESYVRINDQSLRASREMREVIRRSQNKKDIRFHFGDHEKLLFQYLDANENITLQKFMTLSGLKRFFASRKLILLVLAGVLRLTPHEKGDLYSLAYRSLK
ncbi:MAG TPA: ATP-binding protein [Ohtaekwangia sp.]